MVEYRKVEYGKLLRVTTYTMTWDDAQKLILELNSKLGKGETPWRLPTRDEVRAAPQVFLNPDPENFNRNFFQNAGDYWVEDSCGNVAGFIGGPGSCFGSGSDERSAMHLVLLVR